MTKEESRQKIEKIRGLLKAYDDGICTEHEVTGLLFMAEIKEIVEILQRGEEVFTLQAVCAAPDQPPPIVVKAEISYHPVYGIKMKPLGFISVGSGA